MRRIGFVLLLSSPIWAAVTGTVINRTTGQPQAGATVGLFSMGQNGLDLVEQAKSDVQGRFTINQEVQPGPHMIRATLDAVTYNLMLPPGSPATNLTVEVYNSSKQPGAAKVGKHMLLFAPGNGQMAVDETYLCSNDGKTTWNDPGHGTVRFYLPAAAGGKVSVNATGPGGLPLGVPMDKTSTTDVYAVDFPVKPGETRIDLSYTVPYTEGAPYAGKIVTKDDNTYIISANGVSLQGENLNDLGNEPRTQAHIYGLTGTAYKIVLTGTAQAAPPAAAENADAGDSDSGPRIEVIMPRLYGQVKLILALALGALALGLALLYRAAPSTATKETNERGRR
ncbi:MAG TPA: carboxypeptidase-like regulatory domain-containing protein [Terracidiphilus sp.]|nr:carboxypeptidase-like regulatory domain-containing protein [Terracidiphilus sp.]